MATKTLSPSIFPILLVNFIGTLGYSIVLPFLVVLVLRFGGNEFIYGMLGATYSFFQLIGAPILGKWSDRVGRKRILAISQAGTFAAWVLFLVALLVPTSELFKGQSEMFGDFILTLPLILLFGARILDGLTGGNVSVANAYLADITPDEERSKNFGKMSASANLGFIFGPALAGLLGSTILGDILPVIIAMAISLVAIFVIQLRLVEISPCEIKGSLDEKGTRKIMGQEHKECHAITGEEDYSFKHLIQLPGVTSSLVIYFLVFLSFNFFYVAFPIHAMDTLSWSILELGVFFSVMGGALVLVQGPLMSSLTKKYSESQLIISGAMILTVGFVLFYSQSYVVLFTAILIFALGNGIMWPSFLSLISKVVDDKYQGAFQGFASSSGSVASIVGLITGGVIYGFMGQEIFFIPGVIMFLIAIYAIRSYRPKKETA